MREQEFQQDCYRKGQQVGQGRETMGARREEKRMNYDGQWGERVALSRVTEIPHKVGTRRGTKLPRDGTPGTRKWASYHHSYQLEYDSTV